MTIHSRDATKKCVRNGTVAGKLLESRPMGSRRRSQNRKATLFFVSSMALTTLACEHTLDVGHDLDGGGEGATTNDGVSSEAGPTDASAANGSCAAICEKFVSCGYVDASDMTTCNAQCTVTPRSFLDCIAASTCQTLVTCAPPIPVFDPPETGSSGNSTACKAACDDLKFFSCIDAADHSNCRTLCDTRPEDARDTFVECKNATSTCNDRVDCYDQFTK